MQSGRWPATHCGCGNASQYNHWPCAPCLQELGRTFKTLGVGWAWETLRRWGPARAGLDRLGAHAGQVLACCALLLGIPAAACIITIQLLCLASCPAQHTLSSAVLRLLCPCSVGHGTKTTYGAVSGAVSLQVRGCVGPFESKDG